jgi:hypothetical protein
MADQFTTYSALGDLLATYRVKYADQLDHAQILLAQEAAQHLRDLEFLINVIDGLWKKELSEQPLLNTDNVLKLLQEGAKTDVELAKWLGSNPNLQARQSVVGLGLGSTAESKETVQMQDLRLRTESFYYHAHRLLDCLTLLPNLKKLKCEPIQIVRNQLMEHPEGPASGVLYPSFSFNSVSGPVIKGLRINGQDQHQDPGLFPNSEGLCRTISTSLVAAIAKDQPAL